MLQGFAAVNKRLSSGGVLTGNGLADSAVSLTGSLHSRLTHCTLSNMFGILQIVSVHNFLNGSKSLL